MTKGKWEVGEGGCFQECNVYHKKVLFCKCNTREQAIQIVHEHNNFKPILEALKDAQDTLTFYSNTESRCSNGKYKSMALLDVEQAIKNAEEKL